MKRWNICITGFGRVAWHVADLLHERCERYRTLYGADVRLTALVGSQNGLYEPEEGLSWPNLRERLRDPYTVRFHPEASPHYTGPSFLATMQADVLIEAGPNDYQTGEPGFSYLSQALERGIHGIAISKGALVYDFSELRARAERSGVSLKISGATAAALPTIDLFTYNLLGCRVMEVTGIFTGTANYVLTRMAEENLSIEEAVKEAQEMGIAEPDPRFDLDGWDTAAKLLILCNAAFGTSLKLSDMKVCGIGKPGKEEVSRWREQGVVPKLVGRIRFGEGRAQASVERMLLPLTHPLAQVKGTTKAIWISTDVMGDLLVVGGKSDPRAAAAAALKDLEHILAKHT